VFSKLPALGGRLSVSSNGYETGSQNVSPTDENDTSFLNISLGGQTSGVSQVTASSSSTVDSAQARAEANLGWWYETGAGGYPQDYNIAMKWYRKAANDGDVIANWNIARLYEHGWGVEADSEAAKSWYQKAADRGDERSRRALETLQSGGHNIPY